MIGPVTLVRACLRDGSGGSPTAVLADASLTDAERRQVPGLAGASHAVFVSGDSRPALRFFTSEGELPACGHGTVAALAVLAQRAGKSGYQTTLHAGGRVFDGWATADARRITAAFDPGPVQLRAPAAGECDHVLSALGLEKDSGVRVASVGRPRLLVPVADTARLAALTPDFAALRAACDDLGLLGCYVHSPPDPGGRLAARMFAPSIGVPEDIANANSTACLAAHLAGQGIPAITVDMGDAVGSPATITATTRPGPAGTVTVRVGGDAAFPYPSRSRPGSP
ncbi:PhzF family phenazine biosynthesis protein [Amycolatopsis australiensis]|uniref:Phenazine biosynthesis-like protein n=1 Tax=Amycolatopsis australiensis TaxID=546364 RepID=A0A1K1R736_9PSEU|nr:PhzF family phenazine biosynthesis isomerase [Amycolatopsis australiensis]SFW67430.1 Phenazine biosynthesis-like protein [Amycolatopsis australiensis]